MKFLNCFQGEKIASGIINDPGGQRDLTFLLENSTNDDFKMECVPKIIETHSKTTYYECGKLKKNCSFFRNKKFKNLTIFISYLLFIFLI